MSALRIMRRTTLPLEERFWRMVDRRGDDECWPWLGEIVPGGYGRVQIDGVRHIASRVAFRLSGGVLRPGELVCHSCDNPPCCNPRHLFAGTHLENVADCLRKGRDRHPVGEEHPSAKLTAAQAREIRERRRAGEHAAALAREFGVSSRLVYGIAEGTFWAAA